VGQALPAGENLLAEDSAALALAAEEDPGEGARRTSAPRSTGESQPLLGRDLKTLVENYERELILAALAASGGRQRAAASLLQVLPTTLNEKMRRFGLRASSPSPEAQGGPAAETCDEFRWRGKLAAGKTLELKSIHGAIDLAPATNGHVSVVATRRRPADLPMTMDVRVAESPDAVVISVVPAPGTVPTDGRKRASRADLRVDFEVRVPKGVRVVARTFRGDVEIRGPLYDVDAETYSGSVRLRR
jgi:regulatory Fis family protein